MKQEGRIWKQSKEEKKIPPLRDFTVPELDRFRELCNFTDDELAYFELRSKDKSNVQIAYELNISESKVSKLARKVKSKIIRIL